MNHKQKKVLQTIFHDPISANIHWRDIEHLLKALGAEGILVTRIERLMP